MKAAEHMAIRFALERYQKGEVKVNAVHQMMEHMSRQMDSLRQILKLQEEKMNKAGILVESHADILDRMFWAEVPESGKKTVLLSNEAPCVPPRNLRQFVEVLLDRDDKQTSAEILNNYSGCLGAKDAEARRKTAIGLSQLADLYSRLGGEAMGKAIHRVSEQLCVEKDPELQSLLSAAFVRLSQEASEAKNYQAVNAVCGGMELLLQQRPVLVNDLRPRVGVENRIPEFIEEALRNDPAPADLLVVLRRTSQAGAEHLADRFFRCMRRDECDRMVELVKEMGSPALTQLREIVRTGQPRQAAGVVGLLSRLDVDTLLELLPARLPEWNRFYHDIVVRQIAYGAAPNRGRTLLELAEVLDSVVLPESIDEIGMSGDLTAAPPLLAMARPGEAASRSPFVQLKAIESLGRLRDPEAVSLLREIVEDEENLWLGLSPGVADCGGAVALEDRSALQRSDSFRQRHRAGGAGDCASGYGAGMSVGAATALRAHGAGAHDQRNHWEFVGEVKDSDSRVEPGRGHGHQGRQSAHRQRGRSGDFGGHAVENQGACAAAPGADQ